MKEQWYVGHIKSGLKAFRSAKRPTNKSHPQFCAAVGPFVTKRAAKWAEKHGYCNPHFTGVHSAEMIAKQQTTRKGK